MSTANPPSQEVIHSLYSDHHGWLRNWLQLRLGNAFDAADLAHDTFLRIIATPTPPRADSFHDMKCSSGNCRR